MPASLEARMSAKPECLIPTPKRPYEACLRILDALFRSMEVVTHRLDGRKSINLEFFRAFVVSLWLHSAKESVAYCWHRS